MPVRIQRKRVRGWKMPPNTISVARPSYFGNPFKENDGYSREICVKKFRDMMLDINSHPVSEYVYKRFMYMRDRVRDLEGKDLACFCKEGEPCHGDILIEMSNFNKPNNQYSK